MKSGAAGAIQRVMHFFLPKEEEFFPIFDQMARHAHEGALLLHEMFGRYPDMGDAVAKIADIEHAVDVLRHDCVRRLNDTFVTPIMFDRQDIFDLADILDDVVDFTRAAVDRTFFYRVERVPEAMLRMTAILVQATASLAEACGQLEHLRGAGTEFVHTVNDLENQADSILKEGLAELFRNETNVVEIIKWKEIYDYVEQAVDHCEDTVNLIEAALVKNS
jgi:uncharacterized protein Yka (UPF0111/DUF47 family)